MPPDDPNARPTRPFAAPAAGDPPDATRTFADPACTLPFAGLPPPITGPVAGWPPSLTRYQPLHLLGDGGMGEVYLAHDTQLDRQVAIKFARKPSAESADRLLAEARAAARLHHHGICPLFDGDVADGVPYLTMAFVHGPTLAAELTRLGPCPPRYAAKLVRAVAEAMQYAHDHGVVHRDLKPGNILLTADHQPVVTDFGLAVRLDRDEPADGVITGTPHYMAPEQAAGDAAAIGERTDVFALGVILFEMLTGRVPFDGTAREVLDRVQREPVPPVTQFRPDVPAALADVVATATARDPADRFPGMAEFAHALADYLRREPRKKPRWVLWLLLAVALVFAVPLVLCGLGVLLPAVQKLRNRADGSTVPLSDDERKQRAVELTDAGEELADRGLPESALAKYAEAAQLDPENPDPRQLRARLLEKLGRDDEALAEWTEAVRLGPDFAWYRWHRAELLVRLKRHSDALADIEHVLKTDPNETGCLTLRGEIRYERKEYKAALADLDKVVELTDGLIVLERDDVYAEKPVAHYLRALTRAALGDRKGAEADMAVAREEQGKMPARFREHVRWGGWGLPDPPAAPAPPPSPGK